MYLAEYDEKFPFRGGIRKTNITLTHVVDKHCIALLSFVFRPKTKRME